MPDSPPSTPLRPRAVLVGAPGAGKSTVGRALAARLGVGFRDTDHDVERTAGTSISDIFVVRGEDAFRQLERDAVATALAEHDGVLALGGGAVLDAGTRAALRGHTVVHLEVTLSDAATRVGFNRDRPLVLGNVRAQLHTLLSERRPLYEEVATVTLSTAERTVDEVVDAVVAALAEVPDEEHDA